MWTSFKTWMQEHSPFGNPAVVQAILYALVAVFFVAMLFKCGQANSAEMVQRPLPLPATRSPAQLEILLGSTFVRGPTGVLGMNLRFPKLIDNYATLSVGFDLIGQSNWCTSHKGPLCYNDNQVIVHAQVVTPKMHGFELGIGLAHLQHADNYNSGSINFSLSLEHQIWANRFPNLYWRYQHFSNAGTDWPNAGRDLLLFGTRFN